MNNLRLLTGLFAITLVSHGAYAESTEPKVMTLEDIFDIAEANSAQLRPYFTAEEEADQQISVAKAGRLPDISTSLSLSYIGDGFTTDRHLSDYQRAPIPHFGSGLSIDVNQPIYMGGAITDGIEMAELKSHAARYTTDFQRDDIRFRLAGFYLDLYKTSNLRSVVKSNLELARKVLEDMRARHEQGIILKNDITRYELLLSGYELQLIKLDNTLDILNRNLAVTAGLPTGTKVIPDSTMLARALPKDGEGWWQDEASENSPLLKLARSGVDISKKAESLAESDRRPKIGLQAKWTIDGPILVEVPPINRNLSYWYVGIGVSYNLSSLYKSNRSVKRSRIATRNAIEQLDARREDVSLNVRSDYIRYLESYEELKTQLKSVELAHRNYNTTSMLYSSGMALITDMLDAATARLNAEQQLVNARINIIYYYYKLLFTSGKI